MSDDIKALRWIARVEYRSAAGIVTVDYDIEEIEDLHDLVERGPDWNTIMRIVIRLNPARVSYPNDTIEAAEAR